VGKPGCAKVCSIHKVSISVGGSGPTEYMVYWAYQSRHCIRHFDRFSRFSTAHGRRGVTSSRTHTCIHIHNEGGTENAGLEMSGLENVGPNRRSGKDGTGKHGTKAHGWKSQDWKTRDQISRGGKGGTGKRGNIMCMGSKM